METVREAVNDAVAIAQGQASETVAAVIAGAAAQVEQAQENAQAIAEAAMQTEIGRQVNELRGDFIKCQTETQNLRAELAPLKSQLTEIQATMAASLTLQAATLQTAAPVSVSLIPEHSEVREAVETVTAALPGNLNASAVAESPVVAVKAKPRKLFL